MLNELLTMLFFLSKEKPLNIIYLFKLVNHSQVDFFPQKKKTTL